MFTDEAENTNRLFRSQSFRDPDYPDRVNNFFNSSYEVDKARTIAMIIYIIQDLKEEGVLNESEIGRYPIIKAFLEKRDYADFSILFPQAREVKYLNIRELPDDFYYGLIESINKCHAFGIYTAVNVLIRKLLENLLVDILRKKFGMTNIKIFFDTSHRRFQSFNILLKNFEDKIDKFKPIIPSLNKDFIKKLNIYREAGNSAAHTLEIDLTESELEAQKSELEFLIKTLVRLYNNI